jgi:hypothetical protein
MLQKAVYCRILLSFSLLAGMDWQVWIANAPAWSGYTGEVDSKGRLVFKFGPHSEGQLTIRYDMTTGRVSVWGSLHAFAQGSNISPFYWPEVLATCEALAAALLMPPSAIRVHILETGVTASLAKTPTGFLSQLGRAHYGPLQTPFYAKEPPAGASQPLQYAAGFGQYRVKVYDKGTWQRLQQKPMPTSIKHALRLEIHYRKSKKIAAVLGWNGSLTLANLMQADVCTKLGARLLESWHHIHLPMSLPMNTALSIDESALLIAGSNPDFWQHAKQHTAPRTYKRKRALFKTLQKQQEQHKALPHTAEIEAQIHAVLPD